MKPIASGAERFSRSFTPRTRATQTRRTTWTARAIDDFIAATQERFPDYIFTLGSPVDAHHSQARFRWHATGPGEAEPSFVGFDVIVTDNGKVHRVYGLLDKIPGVTARA